MLSKTVRSCRLFQCTNRSIPPTCTSDSSIAIGARLAQPAYTRCISTTTSRHNETSTDDQTNQEEWDPLSTFRKARKLQRPPLRTIPVQNAEDFAQAIDANTPPEEAAKLARNRYNDELPDGLLSEQQLTVYKRLFGEPKLVAKKKEVEEQDAQEVQEMGESGEWKTVKRDNPWLKDEQVAAEEPLEQDEEFDEDEEEDYEEDYDDESTDIALAQPRDIADLKSFYPTDPNYLRTHPLTLAGRWGTSPSSLLFSKATFTLPIASLLSDTNPKNLITAAESLLGGPGLPYSPSTPARSRTMPQKPVPLRAQQARMPPLAADTFMVAVMPQIHASVTGILVEVRKRLGKDWLRGLMQGKGAQVLDVGGGGAGVMAWRDIVRAEWNAVQEETAVEEDVKEEKIPLGRGTVVMGSDTLRYRSSRLLDNTSFIPRLPDLIPTETEEGAPERKTYDVVIAPHSLWHIEKDSHRKAFVQQLWSLVTPEGGLLIILEKGVPRGFEAVAGARQYLLDNHIKSSQPRPIEEFDTELTSDQDIVNAQKAIEDSLVEETLAKEPGMIVAPCTNHTTCPLYHTPGLGQGRKDWCHFSQRYTRPSFLQSVLGAKRRNHDDVEFSYIAVQRGFNLKEDKKLYQDEQATDKAFLGYGRGSPKDEPDAVHASTMSIFSSTESPSPTSNLSANEVAKLQSQDREYWERHGNFNPLLLPRLLLPPLKRKGHILLDVCTPAGTYERWLVNRRNGRQIWRDARKSAWGDLWALGAWGREYRRTNVGKVSDSNKKKGKKGRKLTRAEREELEEMKAEEREAKKAASELLE